MALAFISVIEWPRIPTFIPKSALSRLVNSCDDFDVRRAIQFNDSIKIIFSRYYFGCISNNGDYGKNEHQGIIMQAILEKVQQNASAEDKAGVLAAFSMEHSYGSFRKKQQNQQNQVNL